MKKLKKFILQTFSDWYNDGSLKEGAALSFYTVLSLPALLIGIASIATFFLTKSMVQKKILLYSTFVFRELGQDIVRTTLQNIPETPTITLATVVSLLFLFITASGIFSSLQDALNSILKVPTSTQTVKKFLKNRLFLFLIVLSLGVLLILTTILQSIFSFADMYFHSLTTLPFGTLKLLSSTTNFVLYASITACLFRYLPYSKPEWRDVWVGSIVSTILFTFGKYVLGIYIYTANFNSAYGAAGSLMALLVWIYYSSQTIFLGAEVTKNLRRKK